MMIKQKKKMIIMMMMMMMVMMSRKQRGRRRRVIQRMEYSHRNALSQFFKRYPCIVLIGLSNITFNCLNGGK